MNLIDPATLQLASKALDAGAMRHTAIAHNIANANVAGARAMKVVFEEMLGTVRDDMSAGRALSAGDVPTAQLVFAEPSQAIALDEQVAAMSTNGLHYQSLLRALDKHMGLVGLAISEGKR